MKLRGNILIFTQWSYRDGLIQAYTLPYVKIIRNILSPDNKIIVVTAEKDQLGIRSGELPGINAEWAPLNIKIFPLAYKRFGWRKFVTYSRHFFKLLRLVRREKIDVIHAFCMPAGSFAYLLCLVSGKTLVMDSYEPHTSAMVETGAWKKRSLSARILFRLEKMLTKKAVHIIATTAGMKEYAKKKYGVNRQGFFVKPACVDFTLFFPRPKNQTLLKELNFCNKLVAVYAGKLGGTYLRDEVFDFVNACYRFWKDNFRFLMLSNETDEEIGRQIKRTGLPEKVVTRLFVPHQEIPEYLSLADFAINAQVPVPSKRLGSPLKDGEYWAMGLPVVISPGISEDSDIIEKNSIGAVIDLQQRENFDAAIKQIHTLLTGQNKEELRNKIFSIANQYRSFTIAEKIYRSIYGN